MCFRRSILVSLVAAVNKLSLLCAILHSSNSAGVREFVTSNDKPRIVAYRYIIEASIDVS
jgi:hypothetical protein